MAERGICLQSERAPMAVEMGRGLIGQASIGDFSFTFHTHILRGVYTVVRRRQGGGGLCVCVRAHMYVPVQHRPFNP